MKHRINLYTSTLQPRLYLLSANFCLIIWALLLAAFIYWSMSYAKQITAWEQKANQQSTLLADKRMLVDNLVKQRDNRNEDPKLLARLEQAQADLRTMQAVAKELQHREREQSMGFAKLMQTLVDQHHPQVWLTQIEQEPGHIVLQGATLDSSAIPVWVEQLGQSDYFAGLPFASAHVFRDNDKQLAFVLSTKPGAQAQGGAK